MKKNHLILVALATIGAINSLHAASNAEESTKAVLDNNLDKLKQYAAQLSQKELIALLKMAKKKSAFYRIRVQRWEQAKGYVIAGGASLGAILAIGGGAALGAGTSAKISTSIGMTSEEVKKEAKFAAGVGAAGGAAVSMGAAGMGGAVSFSWVQGKIKKWQKELNTCNDIIEFLQDKIESVQK